MTRETYLFTDESVVEIHGSSTLHPVEGHAGRVDGEVTGEVREGRIALDPQPSGHVEVPVASLSSGKRLQDLEMRRRIGARRFPTIRYDLERVEDGPDRFTLAGRLTFHGETREVVEAAAVRLEGDRLLVEAEHTFDIRDFGVSPPKILKLEVQPEVRVRVRLVGRRRG